MNNILKRYSLKELKNDIRKYGFNYATKDFIIESFFIILAVLAIAFISHLRYQYILILISISILLIPFIIHAWFKQNYNIKNFSLLSDYLTNIIPTFIQKTKIRFCLGELFDITTGNMKNCIAKAIDYIDNTVDDPALHKNALKIIEDEYQNSRVISVHKLLLNIESSNSINYEDVCANMYEDIERWIKRVFSFQKDLKNRRNKLLALCIISLLLNSAINYMYIGNDYFVGYLDSNMYQISTLLFIVFNLLIITIILTKLHGEWLINDTYYLKDENIKNKYLVYKKGKSKNKILTIIISGFILASSIYFFLKGQIIISLICIFFSIIVLMNKNLRYKKAYKTINKAFAIEFPIWLREISLNLNNYTVLNAIEHSQNSVSYPLRKELRMFIDKVRKDPTSVKAYNEFLEDFDLEDARSSMKVLYALQNISKDNINKQTSNLISRNQDMLDKAESLRNMDSIAGIEMIGYLPIGLLTIQMLISMYSIFIYMMNMLNGAIQL